MVCEGYQKGCADAIQTITFPNLLFKDYFSQICSFCYVEINLLHGIRTFVLLFIYCPGNMSYPSNRLGS